MNNRYQVFIESEERDGSGSCAEMATMEECWKFLREGFSEYGGVHVWWVKDMETECLASGWESGDFFESRAGTAARAVDYFRLCGFD